mmetsp:Transcript_108529/g.315645  ORF Transcript_108529/g.315645 Transcript_108529/m.315645 type:complete len:185 (-) Transcript_108529:298-852(-)
MAEGVHHRFDLFPKSVDAWAWEGLIGTGDMMFVPATGPHVFESVGPSFGLRFVGFDFMSPVSGRALRASGSNAVTDRWVDYLDNSCEGVVHASAGPSPKRTNVKSEQQDGRKYPPANRQPWSLRDLAAVPSTWLELAKLDRCGDSDEALSKWVRLVAERNGNIIPEKLVEVNSARAVLFPHEKM